MTIGDIVLLLVFGAVCYFVGRASMMHTIVKAVMQESELDPTEPNEKLGSLMVEKINNVYYAYVGQKFAGQSDTIDELVRNMKHVYKIESFKITHIEGISKEESRKMAEAIANTYNVK